MYVATNEVVGLTVPTQSGRHFKAYLFNTADLVTGMLGTTREITICDIYRNSDTSIDRIPLVIFSGRQLDSSGN